MARSSHKTEARARLADAVLHAVAGRRGLQSQSPPKETQSRGDIDAQAVRVRFSDPRVHAELLQAAGRDGWLLEIFEQIRAESRVPLAWSGVRTNLAQRAHIELARLSTLQHSSVGSSLRDVLIALRELINAPHLPENRTAPPVIPALLPLAGLGASQRTYGLAALRAISVLELASATPAPWSSVKTAAEHRQKEIRLDATDTQDASAHVSALRAARAVPRGKVVPRVSEAPPNVTPYHAFTQRYDRELDAAHLCDPVRRTALARELQRVQRESSANIARWARRLERFIQARQRRQWNFDLEEGILDSRRLARIVVDPTQPLTFKQEVESNFTATTVALLVDNSGSMRGEPIAIAAACALMIAGVLERCGVPTEILGFTTDRWRGGRSRTEWVAAGRPPDPGRITDLLHIVYKSATRTVRQCQRHVAAMLASELLKENVDGEALLWACRRLLRRAEPRKILMVVSDGAPMDEATLSANDPGYLDRHLRSVIRTIEDDSPVELIAIGIGHDVGAYYANAFTLSGPHDLGEAMVDRLIDALSHDAKNTGCRRSLRTR
jgi:cobaltochelatase CobT